MKNKITLAVALAVIMSVGLGCGLWSRVEEAAFGSDKNSNASNKSLTDKGLDAAIGDEKIGIPECDEVIEFFNKQIDNPEDDVVTKAVKKTALNTAKEKFRESLTQNNANKQEMAKVCREFKRNLDAYNSGN